MTETKTAYGPRMFEIEHIPPVREQRHTDNYVQYGDTKMNLDDVTIDEMCKEGYSAMRQGNIVAKISDDGNILRVQGKFEDSKPVYSEVFTKGSYKYLRTTFGVSTTKNAIIYAYRTGKYAVKDIGKTYQVFQTDNGDMVGYIPISNYNSNNESITKRCYVRKENDQTFKVRCDVIRQDPYFFNGSRRANIVYQPVRTTEIKRLLEERIRKVSKDIERLQKNVEEGGAEFFDDLQRAKKEKATLEQCYNQEDPSELMKCALELDDKVKDMFRWQDITIIDVLPG